MKFKVYVHYEKFPWDDAEWKFRLWDIEMATTPNRVFTGIVADVDIDVPDRFDPTTQVVAALKDEKSKVLAEAQVKANNIEDQIQRLLCIEHKS